nr:type II secretion system F family protein [Bifidobacterium biavatii]
MLTVAVKQGSSIPSALDAVGESMGGVCGGGLRRAAVSLRAGVGWHHAWLEARAETEKAAARTTTGNGSNGIRASRAKRANDAAYGRLFDVLEESLEPAWRRGVSPIARLDAAIEQLDADERARIEEAAGRLSVRLLLPTGLCFLPAFIIVGVIPAIASFLL